MHVYIYTHIDIYTYTHTCIHTYVHTFIYFSCHIALENFSTMINISEVFLPCFPHQGRPTGFSISSVIFFLSLSIAIPYHIEEVSLFLIGWFIFWNSPKSDFESIYRLIALHIKDLSWDMNWILFQQIYFLTFSTDISTLFWKERKSSKGLHG